MRNESPWRMIWTNPRATMRSVGHTTSRKSLWLLAWIYGFSSLLSAFQSIVVTPALGLLPMFLLALILAPFWGMMIFAVWTKIILWVGKLLKGQATFETARAAYAWSCVPLLVNSFLWILLVLFYGQLLFFGTQEQAMLPGVALTILFAILVTKLVFSIWSLIVYLQALAEVQKFSVLRSIGNVIVAALVVGLFLTIVWHLIRMIVLSSAAASSSTSFLDWSWIIQTIL